MTTETTPSDLSDPVLNEKTTAEVEMLKAEVQHYCSKLEKYTLKIEGFQVMLETIMEQVSKLNPTTTTPSPGSQRAF